MCTSTIRIPQRRRQAPAKAHCRLPQVVMPVVSTLPTVSHPQTPSPKPRPGPLRIQTRRPPAQPKELAKRVSTIWEKVSGLEGLERAQEIQAKDTDLDEQPSPTPQHLQNRIQVLAGRLTKVQSLIGHDPKAERGLIEVANKICKTVVGVITAKEKLVKEAFAQDHSAQPPAGESAKATLPTSAKGKLPKAVWNAHHCNDFECRRIGSLAKLVPPAGGSVLSPWADMSCAIWCLFLYCAERRGAPPEWV